MRLAVADLGHRYGAGNWLFRGLSRRFEAGELCAITGPSGSGKSTLLSILAGWEAPAAGRVDRDGIDRVAWVFQNPLGMPRRTAVDHVAFPLLARGLPLDRADREARDVLARFGLGHRADHEFRALSGGEASRLMLARGIATAPQLLLVDEPTAQLDTRTAADLNAVLGELAAAGTITLVATHDAETRAACRSHLDLREFQAATP